MTLPGVAETADVEQDNRLPKLDIPNVIQQKVIPGKGQGGRVQHKSTSEEIASSLHPGEISETLASRSSSLEHFGMKNIPTPLHARVFLWDAVTPPASNPEGHVPVVEGMQEPPQVPTAVGPS